MREALSVAKEEQDEARSRPVSRRPSARHVAEQGSCGRAGDAHAQILHKDNVQHDVHSVGGNDRAHGQLGAIIQNGEAGENEIDADKGRREQGEEGVARHIVRDRAVVGQDAAEKAAERQQAPAEKPARERQKKGQGEDPVGLTEPSLAQQDARGDRAAGGEDEAE